MLETITQNQEDIIDDIILIKEKLGITSDNFDEDDELEIANTDDKDLDF